MKGMQFMDKIISETYTLNVMYYDLNNDFCFFNSCVASNIDQVKYFLQLILNDNFRIVDVNLIHKSYILNKYHHLTQFDNESLNFNECIKLFNIININKLDELTKYNKRKKYYSRNDLIYDDHIEDLYND